MCGPELYQQFVYVENSAEKLIIADPIITRLWITVLFFSTSLFSYYEPATTMEELNHESSYIEIQNAYVTLLWKYLLYRHGPIESARIFSNLILVFLNMLRVGLSINIRLRTEKRLIKLHKTFDRLPNLNININDHYQWQTKHFN